MSPADSPGFLAGVNLPVLLDQYNHDLAGNERFPEWGDGLPPIVGFRYLAMCRVLGFGAVRIWLCEDGEGIRLSEDGMPCGVSERLLESVRRIQQGARVAGLRICWTLLDGNSWRHSRDGLASLVMGDIDASRRFAEHVAAPMADVLDPGLTFALEIVNEPESLSSEVRGADGLPWSRITRSLREIRRVLHDVRPGVPITAGTQAVFLPGLLADGWRDAPVDAVDLHVYHEDGGLPAPGDLPVDIGELPLWAGECGTSHRAESGGSRYLLHYLWGGRRLGYRAVFLWKLEEHLVRWRALPDRPGEGFEVLPLGAEARHLLRVAWAGGEGGPRS